jgi:hypothetical protein
VQLVVGQRSDVIDDGLGIVAGAGLLWGHRTSVSDAVALWPFT